MCCLNVTLLAGLFPSRKEDERAPSGQYGNPEPCLCPTPSCDKARPLGPSFAATHRLDPGCRCSLALPKEHLAFVHSGPVKVGHQNCDFLHLCWIDNTMGQPRSAALSWAGCSWLQGGLIPTSTQPPLDSHRLCSLDSELQVNHQDPRGLWSTRLPLCLASPTAHCVSGCWSAPLGPSS